MFLISLKIHWQQFLSLKKNITFNLGSKSLLIRLLFCPIKETYSYDYSSIYLIWGIVCFEACTFGASSALTLFFEVINFYVRASVKLFFLKSSLKVSFDEKTIVYFVLTISSQLVNTEILFSIHITCWKKYFC